MLRQKMSPRKRGQFRATLLWNSTVSDFKENIKLVTKKHRHFLTYYDDTFTGRAASKLLLARLQQNELFGSCINKMKVDMLLNKFLATGVIENVLESKLNKRNFHYGGLYRISNRTTTDVKKTAISLSDTPKILEDAFLDHFITIYKRGLHIGEYLHVPIVSQCLDLPKKLQEDHCKKEENVDQCLKIKYTDFVEGILALLVANKTAWRNKVIQRLSDVMGTAADKILFALMNQMEMWPSLNACLMRRTFQRRRETPSWVEESLKLLGFYGVHPQFTKDVYKGYLWDVAELLGDFLCENLKNVTIFSKLSLTIIQIYVFLNDLDNREKYNDDPDHYHPNNTNQPRKINFDDDDDDDDDESGIDEENTLDKAKEFVQMLTSTKKDYLVPVPKVRNSKVCLETEFSSASPVTSLVFKTCEDQAANSKELNTTEILEKVKNSCTETRCKFFLNPPCFTAVEKIVERIEIAMDLETPNFKETMEVLGNICYKKKAEKWKEEIKVRAIHVYRLVLLFLPPRLYNCLEMALFVLSMFTKLERRFKTDKFEKTVTNLCGVIIGSEQCKSHAYLDILEFFTKYREELFKPFEIEQIMKDAKLNENSILTTQMPNTRPTAAKHLRLPLAEKNQIPFTECRRKNDIRPDHFYKSSEFWDENKKLDACSSEITPQDFTEKTIAPSVKALEDMLDQIIADKNVDKEKKRKSLKLFSERYPHIYQRRFKEKSKISRNTRNTPEAPTDEKITKSSIRV